MAEEDWGVHLPTPPRCKNYLLSTKLFAHFHTGHPLTIAQNVFAALNHFIAYSSIERLGGQGRVQF
jgi:hypothetical protein